LKERKVYKSGIAYSINLQLHYYRYKNGIFPFPPKVDLPRAEELTGVSTKGLDWVRLSLKNSNS